MVTVKETEREYSVMGDKCLEEIRALEQKAFIRHWVPTFAGMALQALLKDGCDRSDVNREALEFGKELAFITFKEIYRD
jgi:hypothetical protein